MKTITTAILTACLVLAGGSVFAQDTTKKDGKEGMARDEMKKSVGFRA